MKNKPLILAITPGSLQGVGPELLIKALNDYGQTDSMEAIWCGDEQSLYLAAKRADFSLSQGPENKKMLPKGLIIKYFEEDDPQCTLEKSANALRNAVSLALKKEVDAIVTGPMDKASLLALDDGSYHGQTEFLAKYLAKKDHKPFMAFMGGPFLLSLMTTHIPLRRVADTIPQVAKDHLRAVALEAKKIYQKPLSELKIAVLGLNPHAGENGLLGFEEQEILQPIFQTLKKEGLNILGPLPADGFFAYFHTLKKENIPDVVVALYHDQGLIPYKLLTKGTAVNVTLGLSVPRTSPAHGTAVDLTGKNLACPQSSKKAIDLALILARNCR